MQKNETRPLSHTHIQKSTQSRLKFLNIRSETLKLLKENIKGSFLTYAVIFFIFIFGYDPNSTGTKYTLTNGTASV